LSDGELLTLAHNTLDLGSGF